VVRNCLDGLDEDPDYSATTSRSAPHKARSISSPEREKPFVRPVERLAAWNGFSVEVIVSGVSPPSAATLYKACGVLASRCNLVRARLEAAYPQLVATHA
jgi:hypothetical protein